MHPLHLLWRGRNRWERDAKYASGSRVTGWFTSCNAEPHEQGFRPRPSRPKLRLAHSGGEGGIRTHGTRKGSTVFETARFNRSRTSPYSKSTTFQSLAKNRPAVVFFFLGRASLPREFNRIARSSNRAAFISVTARVYHAATANRRPVSRAAPGWDIRALTIALLTISESRMLRWPYEFAVRCQTSP